MDVHMTTRTTKINVLTSFRAFVCLTNAPVACFSLLFVLKLFNQNLLAFLRSYRALGYFIVGLEQTSSSVSLDGFHFPDQPIVLLLGKEKEGIPVEFLQAVDQCVEIPQLGIIRSLNVHVSGAISIWEYARQQIVKQETNPS